MFCKCCDASERGRNSRGSFLRTHFAFAVVYNSVVVAMVGCVNREAAFISECHWSRESVAIWYALSGCHWNSMFLLRLLQLNSGRVFCRANVAPAGASSPMVEGIVFGLAPNRQGSCSLAHWSGKCPEMTKLINKWVKQTLPDTEFRYSAVQLNHNYAAKKHIDSNNLGPSYIISLGNHQGGQLWTADRGVLDCHHKWKLFDGNTEHATQPYTGEERYSFILFTPAAYNKLSEQLFERARELGLTAIATDGADDAYFQRFRDLGHIDEDKFDSFIAKNHGEHPPRNGPGALSVETNGYAAGRGWGWISWHTPEEPRADITRDFSQLLSQDIGKNASTCEGEQEKKRAEQRKRQENESGRLREKHGSTTVQRFRKNQTGLHVVQLEARLDSANSVVFDLASVQRFQLYAQTASEAKRFSSWVDKLPAKAIVLACITDTIMARTRPLPTCFYESLVLLGASTDLTQIGYRQPFCFIGFKGASPGQALYMLDAKKQSKELLRLDLNVQFDSTTEDLTFTHVQKSQLKLLKHVANECKDHGVVKSECKKQDNGEQEPAKKKTKTSKTC